MTPAEFAELLAWGREQHHVEFKPPGQRDDKNLWPRVARALLAMANHRDGGMVIIGVEEDAAGRPNPVGLPRAQLVTWRYDTIADALATLADPPIEFEAETVAWEGKDFVVLAVKEFSETPVVCRRALQDAKKEVVLREGKCYVRPRRKPESTEVGTSADMRDLLDLGVEKRLRRHFALGERARQRGEPASPTAGQRDDSRQSYEQEAAVDGPPVAKLVRSRGHWAVRIYPTEHRGDRVGALAQLELALEQSQVRFRGWNFPHIDRTEKIERYQRHIQQAVDWEHHKEFWQFFESGQFLFEGSIWEDWLEAAVLTPAPRSWAQGSVLAIGGVIYRCTEILEFASRLSRTEAGDNSISIDIRATSLRGKHLELGMGGQFWDPVRPYETSASEFGWQGECTRAQLAAEARETALEVARRLFELFGWDPSLGVLRELRDQLVK